jgi:MoaA/NifB/PqqE/SkfB family radical SAM enzyme
MAVQWIATSSCDLACAHCYSNAGRRQKGELSTDEVTRLVLDEMVRLGCEDIVIAGGEAMLRGDFPEIVARCAERRIRWSMHTHGGPVLKHRDTIRKHVPAMVAVSVDGPRAFHDVFRGRTGSFDAALAAIRALKEDGCPDVVAGTTVTRRNADLLADLFPVIAASGADAWGLHLIAPEGRGAEHRELLPSPEQLRSVAGFARRKRGVFRVEMDNEWGSAGGDDAFYRDQPFLCGAGRFSCVVSATGEVMPCTTTDLAESAGNVREKPFSRIWADGFARFRDGRVDGRECWLQSRNGHAVREHTFAQEGRDAS